MFTVVAFYAAVHLALVMHGRSVVAAAAQDGLHAAQVFGGTNADGRAAAENTLNLSPGLRNRSIQIARTSTGSGIADCSQIRVQVSAEVSTLFVEFKNAVTADVTGPCERFYSERERR